MSPIFDAFPDDMRADIIFQIRVMGLDFGSQVFWRFLSLTDFPYRWGRWLHIGTPEEEKDTCGPGGLCGPIRLLKTNGPRALMGPMSP